jgi:hypothetical protein
MKELFSCAHLKPVLHQNLHKPVQGLVGPVGVDSLAPGYLVGEHRPLIAKDGQPLGRMGLGLNRACCALLKPQFDCFLLLGVWTYLADSSMVMIYHRMAHLCLWMSLMEALAHLVCDSRFDTLQG